MTMYLAGARSWEVSCRQSCSYTSAVKGWQTTTTGPQPLRREKQTCAIDCVCGGTKYLAKTCSGGSQLPAEFLLHFGRQGMADDDNMTN